MNENLALNLESALKLLSDRDRDFAGSLLGGFRKYGRFTEKQLPYVQRLIDRANREAKESGQPKPSSEPSFTKLVEMFDKAATELKKPRVMFASDAGEFMVRRAADTSKNPGFLYVLMNGEYAGKIEPMARGARFYATRECPPAVAQALTSFNRDPQKAATAYGMATGSCCFCARQLTDARSVEVGYGPICAGNFGLPWGL